MTTRCAIATLFCGILLVACGQEDEAPKLYINEVMASNYSRYCDEQGEFDDWIELYNATDETLNLEGYYISDDAADPYKRRLGNIDVPGKGVTILWADDDVGQGIHHLPFKLKRDGETIVLTSPTDATIDSFEYADAQTDQSFARFPDGEGELILCSNASPGELNGQMCQ